MSEENSTPVYKQFAADLRSLKGFDAMIAKRAEATGTEDGRRFEVPGFGRTWHLISPELASDEWNDKFAELQSDLQGGYISLADFREDYVDLMLGDEADDFLDAADEADIDPVSLLNWALEEYSEERKKNPTSRSSRSTRRRSKRR